jgi:Importin-beta N-terminal domain
MPSFTIEVEGEASPLSRQAVLTTLQKAFGNNANHTNLTASTQQFANWEKTPGYFTTLQDIYGDFSLPSELRLLSIIQLKNGIDKHWRKTTVNPIAKGEKDGIKKNAIDVGVQEPIPSLALQNALMLAKIVRHEFPNDWPDVFSTITKQIRFSAENLPQRRYAYNTLIITLQVIKELASGRLQRTRKSLQQVSSELLHDVGSLYLTLVDDWKANFDLETAIISHSALKSLRRLLIVGFEHPHREQDVVQFWSVLQQHHEQFLEMFTSAGGTKDMAVKHLLQLSKLHLEMARQHPASFVLLGSTPILTRSWSLVNQTDRKDALNSKVIWDVFQNGDSDEESATDKLALKALLLFRACVKMVFNPVQTFKYQTPQDKEDRKAATDEIRHHVFSNEFVLQLMELLVTRYFVLRPSDLRDWEEEPDEWERREEEIADAWEFSIRSCSEKLFLDLIINFKELLAPRLMHVFQQYATQSNTDVLLKDSLYSAIGIAAACLDDVMDFDAFIRVVLIKEVLMTEPNYNLLRRRIAIMLGQWVPIQPQYLNRVAVYQIFTHLLTKDDTLNDHVVRVTAGRQLRLVLEPFEFSYEDFAPYATPLLSSIMLLTSETELSETKMALLETVRVAVTRLEGHIEPYANGLMSMLPPIWAQSGEEHLMKQAILTMITAIVSSLGKNSLSYHSSILPVIHDSIQADSEAVVYLLEDAMDLWATVLQHTPTTDPPPSPELLSLARSLLPLLNMGSELLRQIFELIEAYTTLSPATILAQDFLDPMLVSMKGLLSMLSSSRARDASLAPHVLDNVTAVLSVPSYFNADSSQQALQHLLSTMVNTGYLSSLLAILKEAYDYHQDPRPNRRPPEVIGPGETSLFTLLSRIALLSPSLFIQAINASSHSLDWLVIEWFNHFDAIGDVLRKKLQTLAITSLLTASNPPPKIMLEQLQSLMTLWTDVVTELGDGAADESDGDYLWFNKPSEQPDWPDATPEDARKRALSDVDPIYAVNIRVFIAERLQQVMQNWPNGGQAGFEQEWLSRVDSVVLKGFVELKLL